MESLPHIPTPPAQRWREFRVQCLPLIVLAGTIAASVLMWRDFVHPSEAVGELETVKAKVISPHEGVVATTPAKEPDPSLEPQPSLLLTVD